MKGSQVDIFAIGGSMDRDSAQQYVIRIAGTGGLEVVTAGLQIKSNGILSTMIGAGAVLAAHVGFDSGDVPDVSTFGGPNIDDSLNTAYNDIQLRLKRDGTTPMTGDLNMNGFKVSGMLDGTASQDGVTLQQMQNYVSLGMRWLYPCAYAGPGVVPPTYGCLLANGKVRASQTVKMNSLPINNDTITFDGAVITFVATPGGPNTCAIVGGSISSTMTNLVNAINTATNIVTSKSVALSTVAFAIREDTAGSVVHIVWYGDDSVPTTANNLPCATIAAGISFENVDPITSGGRFYGAYDSVIDGGTVQGRRDNGVYMYDVDVKDWTLIFANPGSDFFTSASADSGGTKVAGLNGNLFVKGGTGINTVASTASGPDPTPGVRLTINHGDIGTDVLQYHSEESIRLNTQYADIGTAVGDHQNDFNALAAALLGDAKRTALRNVLVNGSFILDPADPGAAGHSFVGGSTPATDLQCMPGWAIRDNGNAGNTATVTLKTPAGTYPTGGVAIGTYCSEVDVTALGGSVAQVFFYQPIVGSDQFKGKRVTFRASVFAPSSNTPRLFIEDSTMVTPVYGLPHSGSAAQYEDLYINTTIAANATWVRVGVRFDQTGVHYVDAGNCVFGANYTSMVFTPRPEIEDIQLVSSMYQTIQWSQHVWVAGSLGGEHTLTFGASLMRLPVSGDLTINATTDPPGDTLVTLDAASLTRHGCHFDLSSAITYLVNDVLKGDLTVDVRPK